MLWNSRLLSDGRWTSRGPRRAGGSESSRGADGGMVILSVRASSPAFAGRELFCAIAVSAAWQRWLRQRWLRQILVAPSDSPVPESNSSRSG